MPWKELHITTTADKADLISDELLTFGATAITFSDGGDDPIFEPAANTPRIWSKTIVIALFEQTIDISQAIQRFNKYDLKIIDIGDEDWVRKSLDSFHPMQFGKKLWVCPSWKTPPKPEAVNITLDPGLAFGTGSHATTSLCLEWLEENIQSEQCVIDYGCGSGILGIAALKLGAKKVIAIDNDEQALKAALQNSELNNCDATNFVTYLPKELPKVKVDILIANILAKPLIELAPTFAELTNLGGKLVLSGILFDQIEMINNVYKKWYIIQPPVWKEEWVRLVGIRSNNI